MLQVTFKEHHLRLDSQSHVYQYFLGQVNQKSVVAMVAKEQEMFEFIQKVSHLLISNECPGTSCQH